MQDRDVVFRNVDFGTWTEPAVSDGSVERGQQPWQAEPENPLGAAQLLECHHVAGEDCYILKVTAPDLESLQGVLRDLRGSSKTQMSTRTTIVLGTVFEKPGFIPVEPD